MYHVEWYHVCWPRLAAKRVEPVVSISWASCFKCRQNVERVAEERMLAGKLFQMVGAAVRKPRVPNDKLHRVTDNRLAEADRKIRKTWVEYWQSNQQKTRNSLQHYVNRTRNNFEAHQVAAVWRLLIDHCSSCCNFWKSSDARKYCRAFLIMDARSAMRPCYILPMFFFIFFYARLSWPNGWTDLHETFTRGRY